MTTLRELVQPEGKSRSNVHMRSNFSSDQQVATGHNKTLDNPNRVKLKKTNKLGNDQRLKDVPSDRKEDRQTHFF